MCKRQKVDLAPHQMGRITWREGVVQSPSGPAREIVAKNVWTERTFITKDGCPWKRFFNVWTQDWTWGEEPLDMLLDEATGKIGFYAGRSNLMSVEEAVCTAWRKRAEDSPARVCVRPGTEGGHCDNLRWEIEEGGEPTVDNKESWKPLVKWCVGIVPVPPGYEISSQGRLRSPSGEVTAGFWAFGRRWAAVKNVGLVDLTTASGLRQPTIDLKPVMVRAAECMLAGFTPKEYAESTGVEEGSAWTYFCVGAQKVHPADLIKVGPKLVSKDLWKGLKGLDSQGDPVMGGPLKELMDRLEDAMPPDGEFMNSEYRFEQLRFARLVLQKC
jgi:hypothetical protein